MSENATYIFENDIELTKPFIPIEYISGTLDGDGYGILNYEPDYLQIGTGSCGNAMMCYGLTYCNEGAITNIKFRDSDISLSHEYGATYLGGLFASVNYGTISDCQNLMDIEFSQDNTSSVFRRDCW